MKPGTPFHIVVDEQSKRKIPAVVAFDQGERHFGNGALQLAMRKPKETYMWAHTLLGKDINSPQVATLRAQGFPWSVKNPLTRLIQSYNPPRAAVLCQCSL